MKLLAMVDGELLIDRTLSSLLNAGVPAIIVVVSTDLDLRSARLLQDPRVHSVVNSDPGRGMFSSIQAGLGAAAVAGADPIVVLPADMPFVAPATVQLVADTCARVNLPVAATRRGRHGHPLAIPARLVSQLLSMDATVSLKDALGRLGAETTYLEVDDDGVVRDVDVPADLG